MEIKSFWYSAWDVKDFSLKFVLKERHSSGLPPIHKSKYWTIKLTYEN